MKTGRGLRAFLITCGVLTGAWLVVPTLVVIPISFSGENSFAFPPSSWSLRHYTTFFTEPSWLTSLLVSLQLALLVTAVATVLGTTAAFALARRTFVGKGIVEGLFMAPLIVPGIVVAVAMYATFLGWGLIGTPIGFIAAHTVLALPFVTVNVTASLAGFDRVLERASATLGASPWTTFRSVTFPLIRPGVLGWRPVRLRDLVRRGRRVPVHPVPHAADPSGADVHLGHQRGRSDHRGGIDRRARGLHHPAGTRNDHEEEPPCGLIAMAVHASRPVTCASGTGARPSTRSTPST
ncbi:ABC transporter permease [Streptomyces indonesiensis]